MMKYINIDESQDIAFNEIMFHSPVVVFDDADESKILNTMFEQSLIPIAIIRNPENEIFMNIDRNKPEEIGKLNAVIIPIKFTETYWA